MKEIIERFLNFALIQTILNYLIILSIEHNNYLIAKKRNDEKHE